MYIVFLRKKIKNVREYPDFLTKRIQDIRLFLNNNEGYPESLVGIYFEEMVHLIFEKIQIEKQKTSLLCLPSESLVEAKKLKKVSFFVLPY